MYTYIQGWAYKYVLNIGTQISNATMVEWWCHYNSTRFSVFRLCQNYAHDVENSKSHTNWRAVQAVVTCKHQCSIDKENCRHTFHPPQANSTILQITIYSFIVE